MGALGIQQSLPRLGVAVEDNDAEAGRGAGNRAGFLDDIADSKDSEGETGKFPSAVSVG